MNMKQSGNNLDPEQFKKYVFERLYSKQPHPDLVQELLVFGQFVGSWEMDVIFLNESNEIIYHQKNEWFFFWILDGRAIQDILIGPNMNENLSIKPGKRRMGTSVRQYDTEEDIWNITWFGVTGNDYVNLKGKKINDEILLEGIEPDGSVIKWIFKNIELNSFEWEGYNSNNEGRTWHLDQKMIGTRKKSISE